VNETKVRWGLRDWENGRMGDGEMEIRVQIDSTLINGLAG